MSSILKLFLFFFLLFLPLSYKSTGMEDEPKHHKRTAEPLPFSGPEAKKQKTQKAIATEIAIENINVILSILNDGEAGKAQEQIITLLTNKQLPPWKNDGWGRAQKDLEDSSKVGEVKARIEKIKAFYEKALQKLNLPSPSTHEHQHIHLQAPSYNLISLGPEEKWRWRNNFNVSCQVGEGHHSLQIDFSPLHKELTLIKNNIEALNTGYFSTDNCNVIVPAISILYETLDGKITHTTGYIPNITPREIKQRNSVVLLSGLGTNALPTDHETAGQIFHLTMGVIEGEALMKRKLLEFYKIHDADHNNPLNGFKHFISNLIGEGEYSASGCNFGTYFYHTEQWFSFYLFQDYYKRGNKAYGNLCTSISHILTPITEQVKKIHQIIFHLASKHDICDICSPTLSVLLENLDLNRPTIIELLKNRLPGSLQGKDGVISPDLGFFIITSSDRSDLNQARLRKFYIPSPSYRHGDRRNSFGRDQSINSEIIINRDVPYKYVQVPIDREGNPINLQ